jgi:alpha-galactosidase
MDNCQMLSDGGITVKVALEEAFGFQLLYFGPASAQELNGSVKCPVLPAGPDAPPGPRLLAQRGDGYAGLGLIDAVCLANGRTVSLNAVSMRRPSDGQLILSARDDMVGLDVEVDVRLVDGLLKMSTHLRNSGRHTVLLIRCAALQIPLMDWAQEILTGFGSWAREGHESRRSLAGGFVGKSTRLGRSGFDGPPGATICEAGTTDSKGRALGVQLAWSGSHLIRAERLRDGTAELSAEAVYEPGEIVLAPGDEFHTPEALVAISEKGFDGLKSIWHNYARSLVQQGSRPVHFNTWEARYFDFDEASLISLAAQAAELGVERFVLDDGWFAGRRDDRTSLGDWKPDEERFPYGLGPLIEAVQGMGMTFGLWVEPEMVSRESRLYRAHPEWVLGFPDPAAPTGRNQLVLDLGNPDVRAYLFGALSDLLRPGGIGYLKWDCNRELYPASHNATFRANAQVLGLYALLDRLRAEFPGVEIESCASGGGRIDFGILPRVMRFWASDATDAHDRIRIQDSLSRYIPMELMGSHVGPSPNPITGRAFPMLFRGLVSVFGHLGVELDPAQLNAEDREMLAGVIALYKQIRHIGLRGTYRLLNADDPALHVSSMTSEDESEFVLRVLRIGMSDYPTQTRIAIAGLPTGARYKIVELIPCDNCGKELGTYSAEALAWTGIHCDPRKPDQGRLFHFVRNQ